MRSHILEEQELSVGKPIRYDQLKPISIYSDKIMKPVIEFLTDSPSEVEQTINKPVGKMNCSSIIKMKGH